MVEAGCSGGKETSRSRDAPSSQLFPESPEELNPEILANSFPLHDKSPRCVPKGSRSLHLPLSSLDFTLLGFLRWLRWLHLVPCCFGNRASSSGLRRRLTDRRPRRLMRSQSQRRPQTRHPELSQRPHLLLDRQLPMLRREWLAL